MATARKAPALVVIQLSGGNDTLNTVIPYSDGRYYDYRKLVHHDQDKVLPISDTLALNPSMGPVKRLFDEGKVAVINGIGYPTPNRSHFRSMDIWHTALPEDIGHEGWLGRAIKDMDPHSDNVLTGVNFGRGMPRALQMRGVPVASVGNLETYGLYPDLKDEMVKQWTLEAFSQIYGTGAKNQVLEFLGQTGSDALRGADILRTAPAKYKSSIEYGSSGIAQSMKSIAQVLMADLGTRIFYTQHGSFDTHSGEVITHAQLWNDVAGAIGDFYDDLREHGMENDAAVFVFSEFGRRIKDNGSGTDHGSGGSAFVIGGRVKGGLYGDYPSLQEKDQLEGDLRFNNDFRSTYSTLLDQWLGLEPSHIVNGNFEQFDFIQK
jgi:uncharacterized protein (DUF1501 family)